jgi:hypothetical protein
MRNFFLPAFLCFFMVVGVSAQDLPGPHLRALISDTWGARYRGDPPEEALWGVNEDYGFGPSMSEMLLNNPRARFSGKLSIDGRETSINLLSQSCLIYLPDETTVTYAITFFVDATRPSPKDPPRGYFAVRLEVRSSNLDYINNKFRLLVDEVNREFTAPITPTSGRSGPFYHWGAAPIAWRQWPLELYFQEKVRLDNQITYYHFSQLGQKQGERNHRYLAQTLYNWILNGM